MAKDWEYFKDLSKRGAYYREEMIIEDIEKLNLTPIENIAYVHLSLLYTLYGMNNLIIYPQKQIGKYRVDFLIIHKPYTLPVGCDPLHKIIIECDGHEWHEKSKEQARKDKERDRFFTKQGYSVMHYTGSEIVSKPMKIYLDLDEFMAPQLQTDNKKAE